jgi:hypothetical protein
VSTCVFCPNELNANTKPEHILLSALGGRKTTKDVICSDCNQRFGSTIDAAIARQVAILRNLLQLESGTGNPPPGLGQRQSGKETIKIKSDGTPKLVGKPFTVTPLGDGKFNLQISAHSPEELASFIPHIAAQMKTTEENVRKQLKAATATATYRRPGNVHFPMPFGGEYECAALMKSCLTLWGTCVGNDELKSAPYRVAREYVMRMANREANQSTAVSATLNLDSRPLPQLDNLTARYGEFFNLIYIRSNALGRVIGHFTLYNIIAWQFVMAESGGTPDLKIALISDPFNPTIWSDTIASEVDIDMAWLNSPDFDVSRSRDRLSAIIVRSQKDGMTREIGRISDAEFQKQGFAPTDPITDFVELKPILDKITTLAAHQIMNVPYQEVISGEMLLAPSKGAKGRPEK